MSRRRRREDDATSFDLFLDTVCNMFGGIVFITMLVALMAFANAELVPGQHGLTVDEVEAAVDSRAEQAAIHEQRLHELRIELDELERTLAVLGDDPTEADAEARRKQLVVRQRVVEARSQLADRSAARDLLKDRLESIQGDVDETRAQNVDLQAQIDKLRAEISDERNERIVEARLPVERRTTKVPIQFVLKSGKIHELYNRTRQTGEMAELRDVNLQIVGKKHHFTLRPDGGYPVTANLDRHPRWRELMRVVNLRDQYVYLMVYPDSYESFLTVKTTVLMAGLEYQTVPMTPNEQIVLEILEHHTTQ